MDPIFTFLLFTSLAQETPTPTGWGLIDLIGTFGITGVIIFLYFDERKERRQTQQQMGPLLERIIAALTESTSTLDRVQDSMRSTRQDPAVSTDLKEEIAELITELKRR